MMTFVAWWNWFLFRLFGKGLVLFALTAGGVSSIKSGWRMLDLSEFRIVAESDTVRIDGGVGELGVGVLSLLIALALCWRWLRAWARGHGAALG
jgi:hypothetical protein